MADQQVETLPFQFNTSVTFDEWGSFGPDFKPNPTPVPVIRKALMMRGYSEGAIERRISELREEYGEPKEESSDGLPEDFPARAALIQAGVDTVEKVESHEDLTEVSGVGEATAEQIEEYIAEE